MGRLKVVAPLLCLGVLAVAIAASVLLAPASHGRAQAQPAQPRPVAAINGDGAASGTITASTLHQAHIAGSQPVACRDCHAITLAGFARPDRERCLRCHPARKAALHAAVTEAPADKDPRECIRCHDFVDARPTATRAWQCQECHPTPHSDDMLITGTTAETCGRCHSPHGEESTAPRVCTGCHEEKIETGHQTTDDPGTGSCLACHRQHDAKENARARCVECHFTKAPRVARTALVPGAHEACVGCHQPHGFSKKTVATCGSCHGGRVTLAANHVGAHRDCTNCHDPHDALPSARLACERCHQVVPQHPKNAQGHDCLGCHPPHPRRAEATQTAAACSTCHTKAVDDHAFHRGATCTACHQPHGFKLTFQPSFCLGCHAGRVGHAAPVAVSQGHGDCGRCHQRDPHAPARPPACATCHAAEGSTVPPGHATCTSCHDQHLGGLKPRAKSCLGCHPDRKAGPHGAIQGGCQNCHRQHGPGGTASPPACATCHPPSALPGLHQQPKHATCTDCHDPHGPAPGGRAGCLRCHADRANHEPTASTCGGCHPFKGGTP